MAETGHAKNVSHLESMISFCTGYGDDYKPIYKLDINNASHAFSRPTDFFGRPCGFATKSLV